MDKLKELDTKKAESKKKTNMEKTIENAFHDFSNACVDYAEFA